MNRRLEKSIASVHLTLTFLEVVSQRLFGCLGLFIPPPLTHLRFLDCVEVQRNSRYLKDRIQSIQVLNCSSIDLHMLSVCA
jgi:predicted sugar kinase